MEQYGDGTYRFKISIRNIPLPDNSRIDVILGETPVVASLHVMNKKAKFDTEASVSKGQYIEE